MAVIVRNKKLFTGLGGGGGASLIRRHAFVDGTPAYDYCGSAPLGTLETTAKWTITKITIAADGSTTTAVATNVAWTDRLTATYV
jgi:hypothetical protein